MPRHVPMRTCVACRNQRPKAELMRVVRTPEGRVEFDPTGGATGRGAYVCRRSECVERIAHKGAVRRALGQSLPEEAVQRMLQSARAVGSDAR
ncbi:MAG: YlxR family protein [Armatimonadota bacterium]|nr:MAG: YlxR family protein [Armatimonadota bacterium]